MRFLDDDPEFRKDNRLKFWWIGFLGGLAPDLDFIPSLFTGEHLYTYHHTFTHTFLAVGILSILVVVTRFNPYMLVFALAWELHMFTDFIDNSITPLGPFFPSTEWGLLSGWGEIPGGSWASEYWLLPGYTYDHDLWSVFMERGWGIPVNIEAIGYHEFLSTYDLIFIGTLFLPGFSGLLYMTMKKPFTKKKHG